MQINSHNSLYNKELGGTVPRVCPMCKGEFVPSRYRKDQKVCSQPECQHQRQMRNLAAWRQRNPGYFKLSRHDANWAKVCRRRSQTWRIRHKDKVKRYKQAHKTEQREYMREYMHRARHAGLLMFCLVVLIWGSVGVFAQEQGEKQELRLLISELKVFSVENLRKVAVGDPAVADITVLSDEELMLVAKKEGSTNLTIWDESGEHAFNIVVKDKEPEEIKPEKPETTGPTECHLTIEATILE